MGRNAAKRATKHLVRDKPPRGKRFVRAKVISAANSGNLSAVSGADRRATKVKVSIAVPPALLRWVNSQAEARGVSVSAIFTEATERFKHRTGLGKLLEHVGGADDITEDDMEALYAEWRDAGLNV